MKNAVLMTSLTAAILVAGTIESGASDGTGKGHHGPRHSFEELDANADGKITPEEMAGHRQAMFAAADTDGDGVLSRDEMMARAQERAAKRAERAVERMLDRHDADGDGALSAGEMREARSGRMFMHADADGDGAISKAEFDEMRDRHGGGHKHGHGMKDAD